MSCGDHHDTDCSEVLAEVWMFLDDECDGERRALLARHLEECRPCLEEFGLDEHLKLLLARTCGGDNAPEGFKQRLRQSIREIVVRQTELAEVLVEHDRDGAVIEVRTTTTTTVNRVEVPGTR